MKNIYLQILDLHSSGFPFVLASVTRTHGSTPQKPGSSALFNDQGLLTGTVGGGVVEGKVQKLAIEAISTGNSGFYHFNLTNDISKTEEAICGGEISVLIDADPGNSISAFEQLRQSLKRRIPGVLITMVTTLSTETVEIRRYWISDSFTPPSLTKGILKALEPAAKRLISEGDPSGYGEIETGTDAGEGSSLFFLEPVFPPPHLVIAGAGHIGRSLAHFGDMLGFEVTVIDDRPEYANTGNIPDASHIIVKDIGETMREMEKDGNTYVVIVTRGHKDDAAALRHCIGTELAYTGMIGSKNKIATMRLDFIAKGWANAVQWTRIHAPVGIDIKSQTVEEIAVSIAAELVLVKNSRKSYK
jgi:xanthine dehydrogenase accessory factor